MVGGSTVYDIRLKYSVQDQATKGLNGMASAADRAAKSTGGLGKSLLAIAGAAAGFGAFSLGKKLLIDYNSQIDQMQIGLATVIGSQLHVPFETARKEADRLFGTFQEMAKKSPATTKDFVEMANGIARAVTQAGMGTEDLANLTGGAVVAAQAFGIRADMAALDIEQMLRGDVTTRDRMANALLGSMGTDKETFNKMSQADRNRITKDSLSQQSIKDASEAFGQSFAGQMSTLQDMIEITFAQVGLPLVKEITKEVKKWNTWIEKNPAKIKEFVQDFGNALSSGFGMIKDAAGFLMENKDTLIAIAKAWLVFKGVSMAGSGLAGMASGLSGLISGVNNFGAALTTQGAGMAGMFSTFATGLGAVIGPLSLLAAAVTGVYMLIDGENERQNARNKKGDWFREGSRGHLIKAERTLLSDGRAIGAAKRVDLTPEEKARQNEIISQQGANSLRDAIKAGYIEIGTKEIPGQNGYPGRTELALTQTEKYADMFANKEFGTDKNHQDAAMVMQAIERAIKMDNTLLETLNKEFHPEATPAQVGLVGSGVKPEINVKIERIEVMSDDPDRFVHGMVDAFEDVVRNPTQANGTIRGIQG